MSEPKDPMEKMAQDGIARMAQQPKPERITEADLGRYLLLADAPRYEPDAEADRELLVRRADAIHDLVAELRRLRELILAEYEASDNWSTTPAHRDEAVAIRKEREP